MAGEDGEKEDTGYNYGSKNNHVRRHDKTQYMRAFMVLSTKALALFSLRPTLLRTRSLHASSLVRTRNGAGTPTKRAIFMYMLSNTPFLPAFQFSYLLSFSVSVSAK